MDEGLFAIDEPSAEVISRIHTVVDETMALRSGKEQKLFVVGLDEVLVDSDWRLHDAAVEAHDGDVVPAV